MLLNIMHYVYIVDADGIIDTSASAATILSQIKHGWLLEGASPSTNLVRNTTQSIYQVSTLDQGYQT